MDPAAPSAGWKALAEEAALVSRAQRGDRAAFLALLRYYDGSVYRLVYALVRDLEKAGALTHETFVRAWKDILHIPAGQTFYPWLTRLARGLSITHTRRRMSAPELGVRDPSLEADSEAAHVVVDPTDAERAAQCELAFSALNVDQQTILFLRVSERLSYTEIAKTLDIPFGATISRLATARAALRTRLAGPGRKAA